MKQRTLPHSARHSDGVLVAGAGLTLVLALLLVPAHAEASYFDNRESAEAAAAGRHQEPWAPQLHAVHQGGFLLRTTAGIGLGRTSAGQQRTQTFDGVAMEGSLAVGGVVAPGFAIHGTAFGWTIPEPYFELDADGEYFEGYATDAQLSLAAIGPGVTGWIVPVNVYFSGSVGLATMALREADGSTFRLRRGFAMEGLVGKEWMVAPGVGIGVAGAITWHRMPDRLENLVFSGYTAGLRFSFTWN